MGRILYKDIELEEANKKVHFSHSQFTERDINTDWMDSLLSIDKNSLSHAQFGDIRSATAVSHSISTMATIATVSRTTSRTLPISGNPSRSRSFKPSRDSASPFFPKKPLRTRISVTSPMP